MHAFDNFYPLFLYFAISVRSALAVKCFVSKINSADGAESGMSKQECPPNTVCTLAEEIEETTNKRSKFRDCLNEKMCELLELKCQFCYTDFCAPETAKNSSNSRYTFDHDVKCVQCNTKNDSYCLTRTEPIFPCSKGEVCVTFSVTKFDGKNELDRGCSNKEVCNHIGDFCSWCGTDGCLPRMPKIMYLRNPRMSDGSHREKNSGSVFTLFLVMWILSKSLENEN